MPMIGILMGMFGWAFQFASRPSVMLLSSKDAEWLEAVLEMQGFYSRSETDGRWRMLERPLWQRFPHQFIEFVPGEHAALVAPRDVMEMLRASLEFRTQHGELCFTPEHGAFAFQAEDAEPLPWYMHLPAGVLASACVLGFFWLLIGYGVDGGARWGVSGAALSEGRFETIFQHMFAHANAMHLTMNVTALLAFGGGLTSRFGRPPLNWLRFLTLFFLSGFAGAGLYLAVHPMGTVPMIGASGAIYGLVGLWVRTTADREVVEDMTSARVRRVSLIKRNAFLFLLLGLLSWSLGEPGGLAWEAHLGGFLFGLIIGPKLLPRIESPEPQPVLSGASA
jgi:membrane associated rhomboid family serine protease